MPEKATYFTYNEGIEAKHLHLGNLVHSYRDPKSFEPYVEKAYADIEEPAPEWAQSTLLKNYALTLGKAPAAKNDIEGSAGQRYRVAAAAKGTKIEIKDPKKFFNDVTLASNEANKWLSSHLSVADALASQHKSRPQPQIWMLTGIILMTHATWTSISSKEHSFTAGLQAPFDPTGVSAIRRSSVSEDVKPTFGFRANDEEKHIPGAVINETGKYPGTRLWAAQWQRIDIKVVSAAKAQGDAKHQLRLKNTTEGSAKIAVVQLQEGSYPDNEIPGDEEDEDFDDDYWDEFLDAVEE